MVKSQIRRGAACKRSCGLAQVAGGLTKVMDRVIVDGPHRQFLPVEEDGLSCDRPCIRAHRILDVRVILGGTEGTALYERFSSWQVIHLCPPRYRFMRQYL